MGTFTQFTKLTTILLFYCALTSTEPSNEGICRYPRRKDVALKVERRDDGQWEKCVSFLSLLSGPFLKHTVVMLAQVMGGEI